MFHVIWAGLRKCSRQRGRRSQRPVTEPTPHTPAISKPGAFFLIGRLDEAEAVLDEIDVGVLPRPSRVGRELVMAGVAIRRIRTVPARAALERARRVAEMARIPALEAEVKPGGASVGGAGRAFITHDGERLFHLDEVETLLASDTLIVGAFGTPCVQEPPSFRSLRVPYCSPLSAFSQRPGRRMYRARRFSNAFSGHGTAPTSTHRARLRVEIARLREAIEPLAALIATRQGFVLQPHAARDVAVLAPPVEGDHAEVFALLGDGQAWSSSALALALSVSTRTVQRALEELALDGKVESFGRGRACRWIASNVPGFPTSLLLPAAEMSV